MKLTLLILMFTSAASMQIDYWRSSSNTKNTNTNLQTASHRQVISHIFKSLTEFARAPNKKGEHISDVIRSIGYYLLQTIDFYEDGQVTRPEVDEAPTFNDAASDVGKNPFTILQGLQTIIDIYSIPENSFEGLPEMLHHWGIKFDLFDINRNEQWERSDLEQMKAKSKQFFPASERSGADDLQNQFWKELLQTDDLNTVLTKTRFLEMMSLVYVYDRKMLYAYWWHVDRLEIEALIDYDGDGFISIQEVKEAPMLAGVNLSNVTIVPISVTQLLTEIIRFDTEPGEDADGKVFDAVLSG